MYSDTVNDRVKMEHMTDKVCEFIKLHRSYFGSIPKKERLSAYLFANYDTLKDLMAEEMFATGKNPFLSKHPERDQLIKISEQIRSYIDSLGWADVITEDENGYLLSVCGRWIELKIPAYKEWITKA